jgi:hypothetical protein
MAQTTRMFRWMLAPSWIELLLPPCMGSKACLQLHRLLCMVVRVSLASEEA